MTDQEILRLIRHSMAATQELVDLWSKPKEARERAKVAEEQKWTPVGEKLPEENGRYLCRVRGDSRGFCYTNVYGFAKKLMEIDKFDFAAVERAGWYESTCDFGYKEVKNVTHWMPFPEPPEQEAHE